MNFRTSPSRWGLLLVALVLLNAALTFGNVWPTFAIRLNAELSVEVAVLLLVLAGWQAWRGAPSKPLVIACTIAFLLLVLGRYGAVMSHSLYGRDVNLYWDSQHIAGVVGMFAEVAPAWLVAVALLGAIAILVVLYRLSHWSLTVAAHAMTSKPGHRIVAGIAAAVIGLFVVQRAGGVPESPRFAQPVTQVFARQAGLVQAAVTGGGALDELAPPPTLDVNLTNLAGADVLVVFLETYGAVTYDRADIAAALEPARAELDAAIRDTGRAVVSAFADSPTFAGGSWLSHLSFMSGIEVRNPGAYAALMTQDRETLASLLERHGYRTVGLMPGIRLEWPEGAFYGFDALLDARALDYRGPQFGWWQIPDQYALAKFDELEFDRRDRPPLFMLFTTISTHMPFLPTPPYQPDWRKLLSNEPFDPAAVDASLAAVPDWENMGPDYAQTVGYTLRTLAGYLRKHAGRDLVLVIAGDHQPAANVAGEGATWEVPIHIVADRPELVAPLLEHGFVPGLDPVRPHAGGLHELLPVVTNALAGTDGETLVAGNAD